VVQRRDTLSGTAAKQLGDANRWHDLHELNKALIGDPNRISHGQILVLPIYAD